MNEFDFIEMIKQETYKQNTVIQGIGDDAAVIQAPLNHIVTAVDTFVEKIHFSWEYLNGYQIGYRALAANISDIAAMGALPKYYLVSIVIPDSLKQNRVLDIFTGMKELASQYKMDLIGGDTVSGNELVISITIIGHVERNKIRYRSDACNGDIVFVTGTLGDSSAGLHILKNELIVKDKNYLVHRHSMPTPRVEFAQQLHGIKRVVLNDVSDGIGNELHEIANASNVDIIIEDKCIPIHESLYQFTDEEQARWKYFGGEDFELVGTVGAENWEDIQIISEKIDLKVSKIGKVVHKQTTDSTVYLKKGQQITRLEKLGYIHMGRRTNDET